MTFLIKEKVKKRLFLYFFSFHYGYQFNQFAVMQTRDKKEVKTQIKVLGNASKKSPYYNLKAF